MAQFPANCPVGKTYKYDSGANGVDPAFWTTVSLNACISKGNFLAVQNNTAPGTRAGNLVTGFISFATFQATYNCTFSMRGAVAGSLQTARLRIGGNTLYFEFTWMITGGVLILRKRVVNSASTVLASADDTIGFSPQTGITRTGTVKLIQSAENSGIFDAYIDGVLILSAYHAAFVGPYTLTCAPSWRDSGNYTAGNNNTYLAEMQFGGFYLIGSGLPSTCGGPTPDPFPAVVRTNYPGNPSACVLGKKTSWFLEEFEGTTLPFNWQLMVGTFHAEGGFITLNAGDPISSKLELKWTGKTLGFAPSDHLTLETRGRVDTVNLATTSGAYDAFGIKAYFPDLLNWVLLKIVRDAANPALYKVVTSESFGADQNWTLFPAFTAYPLEVTLRIDVYVDEINYYVGGVLVYTAPVPVYLQPVTYVEPRLFCNLDSVHRGYLYYFYVAGSPGFPDLCLGSPSSRTASYRKMMVNLLPQGFPWRNLNTIFKLFLESFAVELDRLHGRSEDLVLQSSPGTSTSADLLKEWEQMALLPDELPLGGETDSQRQQVASAKVTTHYSGPSKTFWETLAGRLGMSITITEGGTRAPARVGIARVGLSRTNDPGNIFIWNIQVTADPNSQLAKFKICVRRLKPAHTEVTFT